MKKLQQELPFRRWGGARRGAGRKRISARQNVPHRLRRRFRKGALHVTVRIRREVWNLRTHRCFRALRRAFERGCQRFGFRLVHFSVQGNHAHFIVETPDAQALGRAMKGLEVRMARALNKVMGRKGPVFADRYHAHLLASPRQGANAVRAGELEGACGSRRTTGAPRRRPILLRGLSGLRAAAGCGAALVDAAYRRREVQRTRASGVRGDGKTTLPSPRWNALGTRSGAAPIGDVGRRPRTRLQSGSACLGEDWSAQFAGVCRSCFR